MSKAIEKCHKAVFVQGLIHPHFLLIHQRLRDLYQEDKKGGGIGTMGITASGRIYVNPDFVEKLDRFELFGVLAHEMLHLILLHHGRRGSRDPWTWNIATDMCINKALLSDNITLPKGVVTLPNSYNGDIFAEAVYEWLMKNPDEIPQKPEEGEDIQPGAGCSVLDDPDPNSETDWRQVALEMRASMQAAGNGNSAIAALLKPRQQKIHWRKIIRHGFELACARIGRDWQSFAKRHRRSPAIGAQFPGWLGFDPKIAVAIDVSGSMNRDWVNQIVSECRGLIKSFPGTSVYLVTHTSEVCWQGWIRPNSSSESFVEAVSFTGGTDPKPAYDALQKAGRWDTLIHFTDCEFMGVWPTPVPAKHLVVGAFARKISSQPPPGTHIIPCEMED